MGRRLGQRDSLVETRGLIVGLAATGMTQQEIADRVGLSIRQVRRWLRRSEQDENRPLVSRPRGFWRVTSRQDDENIANYARETPFTTAQRILEHVQVNCSVRTVQRRLKEAGFRCSKPAKKPLLTEIHAEARILFCQQNINRNWQNVIFTDEKLFSSSEDAPVTLWRTPNTRYEPQHVKSDRRSGRITAGFWGWISSAGPGELVRVSPPRFTSERYIQILEDVLLPSVRRLYPEEELEQILIVQDNSPIHTSRQVLEWYQDRNDIIALDWPARSPDLNPIENMWAAMVRNWEANDGNMNQIRNLDNLTHHVNTIWEHFRGQTFCESLINSMRNRLEECLANNGYYTKY